MSSIDQHQMSELKEIMEDDFQDLIDTYLRDTERKLSDIQQALDAGDSQKVGELAHSLKGASANICALPLSELCATLERQGKSNDLQSSPQILQSIQTEYQSVKTALNQL
ncbi:Hpt domain-containing protein [Bermanella marisrubri]|uniref:Hpt domain protein n=1 Tax=Bermanella marisrubri TaxID=207949 RepID=Q1N2V9_9GAMM|nr:Hpt domain-containing protein [Bermanella marisrubri]EAT12560.1 Hpt domain protein [Oceanobacter sp. RED65] [Bermanella marisrubri]QIZ84883.1 Hpt domain-containing protein [Bermanella marisrubri]